MNCPEYADLNVIEQYQLVGKTVHLLQNNSESFKAISSMIRNAEKNGLLEGITILPKPEINLSDDNFKEVIN